MNQLLEKLHTIQESPSFSTAVSSFDGAKSHLIGYLSNVLELLCDHLRADRAFIALSGFVIGEFTPLAVKGVDVQWINKLPTGDLCGISSNSGSSMLKGNGCSRFCKDTTTGISEHVDIVLNHDGQFLGYACFEKYYGDEFCSIALLELEKALTFFTRLVSEQVFTIRVFQLADTFAYQPSQHSDLDDLYTEIVDRTALAFNADAVALRMVTSASPRRVEVVKSAGHIEQNLMVPRSFGEHVAGKLIGDRLHDWAALTDAKTGIPVGMELNVDERNALLSAGVHACIIMRLGPPATSEADDILGTLAYHIRRPHKFSWRDLALFRLFCQRVANALLLDRQTRHLQNSRDEAEVEHQILLQQSAQATHTDIVSLLAHDLFHKSYHACVCLHSYIERVEKTLRSKQVESSSLADASAEAMSSAEALQETLQRLRSMQQSANKDSIEESRKFSLEEILDEVEATLSGPLRRNRITIKRTIPSNVLIYGPKSLFSGIIFNLILNSVDAARSRSHIRPMNIYVSASVEFSRDKEYKTIKIKVSDEGPGINRKIFRNPSDIFKIGVTTKAFGTGTGLPVARHLAHKHFNGDITLLDPDKAMFEVIVKQKNN